MRLDFIITCLLTIIGFSVWLYMIVRLRKGIKTEKKLRNKDNTPLEANQPKVSVGIPHRLPQYLTTNPKSISSLTEALGYELEQSAISMRLAVNEPLESYNNFLVGLIQYENYLKASQHKTVVYKDLLPKYSVLSIDSQDKMINSTCIKFDNKFKEYAY